LDYENTLSTHHSQPITQVKKLNSVEVLGIIDARPFISNYIGLLGSWVNRTP
jgi:hypothetical protein